MPITDPDWVTPIEITFDEGKPIRAEQGLMLAGNPIAIALGKPGAPRVYGRAAGPRPLQAQLLPLTGLTVGAIEVSNLHYAGAFVNITNSTGSGGVITNVLLSGTVRFAALHSGFASNSNLNLNKNGVSVASFVGTATNVTRNVDVAIAPGDVFEWVATVGNSTLSQQRILASDQYTRIGLPIRESDL
jgi:hypothetical protein